MKWADQDPQSFHPHNIDYEIALLNWLKSRSSFSINKTKSTHYALIGACAVIMLNTIYIELIGMHACFYKSTLSTLWAAS